MHASYDKGNDILAVHKGFSKDERFKGNIDAGDLILDMSTKERVRGIEIMHASKYLQDFKITKDTLSQFDNADFRATVKPEGIVLNLVIKSKKTESPAMIAVQAKDP